VTVALVGMDTKRVRVANLPPEIPNDALRDALAPYGRFLEVHVESWYKACRYAVSNGIRQATVVMTKHSPSLLTVAGYGVLLSFDGQPATCNGCGNAGHVFQDCPTSQGLNRARTQSRPASYANVLANTTPTAETPIQVNPDTNVRTKTKIHGSDSREVPCATPSLEGPANEENDAPNHNLLSHHTLLNKKPNPFPI
jgi:hypothetical protein